VFQHKLKAYNHTFVKINALEYCSLAKKTYTNVKAKNVLIMAEYAMFGRCVFA
jgi:hypothetical protein